MDKTPVAVLGFDIIGDVVHVSQIQGRLGAAQLPEGWEKDLLRSGIEWSQESGYRQIQVISAESGFYWRKPDTPEKQAHNKRMEMRYNATAQELGFQLSSDRSYYYLDL